MGKRSNFTKIEKDLKVKANSFKHGHRYANSGKPTTEYNIWAGVLKRTKNKNDKLYPYYGGRGITVDPRWDDFLVFLEDVGYRPSKEHSLDRIDNNSGYFPWNVRWATKTEQSRNRRTTILVDWLGDSKCLKEVCVSLGWSYKTVWRWYKNEGRSYDWISKRANELWVRDQAL